VVSLSTRVMPDVDEVTLDDRPVRIARESYYYLLNKPAGYLTTINDPYGRPTVASLIDKIPHRVFPVGRLDFETEGLLLFTNDGLLSHRLMHPRFHMEKEYHVLVRGSPSQSAMQRLRKGVSVDGRTTAPAKVRVRSADSSGSWLSMVLREGRNRQIRKMCDYIGHSVRRLIRIRLGSLVDPDLSGGKWRPLTPSEIANLYSSLRSK